MKSLSSLTAPKIIRFVELGIGVNAIIIKSEHAMPNTLYLACEGISFKTDPETDTITIGDTSGSVRSAGNGAIVIGNGGSGNVCITGGVQGGVIMTGSGNTVGNIPEELAAIGRNSDQDIVVIVPEDFVFERVTVVACEGFTLISGAPTQNARVWNCEAHTGVHFVGEAPRNWELKQNDDTVILRPAP